MTFLVPLDIANRACQHMGVTRIGALTDDSVQAGELNFSYDKIRRAELRRNCWAFATKKACIRPVQAPVASIPATATTAAVAATLGTMILNPTLWSSVTTYGYGAIVSDSNNYLWQSNAQDNTNNTPGASTQWDAYFGPMTVSPYDTTGQTGYFAGELVYETPGDGTYTVYLSLQSNNSQDPRAPSQWNAANNYADDAVVVYYAAYASGTTYAAGNTVSYNNNNYVSLAAGNHGNQPDISNTKWTVVPLTLAPQYWNSTVAYTQYAWVTYLGVNYVCINAAGSTGNAPPNATYWVAQAAPQYYVSLIDFNLNNIPSSSAALWASLTSYSIGNQVNGSNGYTYTSVTNSNVGNNPITDNGTNWTNTNVLTPWTTTDNFGQANDQWLQLTVVINDLIITYPLGAGPISQSSTKNVYHLPANYLRMAPQDPKAGGTSYLGVPSGIAYTDWEISDNYIVTADCYPIVFRFVADVTNVPKFDDMFCEGFGARLAMECVERVTQSTAKLGAIAAAYNKSVTDARLVNGIETGPTEPPTDDYIACRA